MKKILGITFLVVMLLLLSFSLVMAKTGKVNLEGEITAVDIGDVDREPSITIHTIDPEGEYTIYFSPGDFSFSETDVGTFVHVKGEYQEDGSILADWVKPVDEDDDDGGTGDSAYCSGEKETAHPVIIVLANKFSEDIDELNVDDLMDYFCDGFGIGQIYLALQTEVATGAAYQDLLAAREDGQGWGEIWKELGSNGKPKGDDQTPPGQDKDKEKDQTPPGQDKDKEKDQTPPGQDKDKEKDQTPPGQDKEKKPKKEK